MQDGTAQTHTGVAGKPGGYRVLMFHKIYSAKLKSVLSLKNDAKLPERRDGIGHQALTARFIYRRLVSVSYHYLQTLPLCRDCGGEPSGPTADYENVCALRHRCARYSRSL
jgi:hypothetical protein